MPACPIIGHFPLSSPIGRVEHRFRLNFNHSTIIPSYHLPVYKGCTTDAHQEYIEFSVVHPVSIRCTPLVHGVLGGWQDAIWGLRLAGDCGMGFRAIRRVEGVFRQAGLSAQIERRGHQRVLASSPPELLIFQHVSQGVSKLRLLPWV